MNILVINTGSSSLKYQLIDMTNESVLAKGVCDRIGLEHSFFKAYKDRRGNRSYRKRPVQSQACHTGGNFGSYG